MTQHSLLVVPFEGWHVDIIDLRPEQKRLTQWGIKTLGGPEAYGFSFVDHAVTLDGVPMCYTALWDGVPIFSAGLMYTSPHSAMAWALVGNPFLTSPSAVKREVVGILKSYINRAPVHRVSAEVEVGFEKAMSFLERLGFEAEGVAKASGPYKEDYTIYGLVKEA